MGRQKKQKPRRSGAEVPVYACPIEGIRLRGAKSGDGSAVVGLLDQIETEYTSDDRARLRAHADSSGTTGPWPGLYLMVVAEDAATGAVVGVAVGMPPGGTLNSLRLRRYPKPALASIARAVVKLKALAVAPDYRHRGIGQQLLQTTVDHYGAAGYTAAYGQIGAAETVLAAWYRKLGFTILDPGEPIALDSSGRIEIGPDRSERLIFRRLVDS